MIQSLKLFVYNGKSLTVGLGFFSLSLLLGSWLTRLPELQQRLLLSDGALGEALFAMSIGSVLASFFTNFMIERLTTGPATFWTVVLQLLTFLPPFFAANYIQLILAMFLLGLANGAINITLNASAAGVERASRVTIMSTCHGMFSVGAMFGAGLASLIAGLGVPPVIHLVVLATLLVLLHLFLLPIWQQMPHSSTRTPVFVLPPRPVLWLVLIGFCVVLAEVVIMDWSAVYMRNTLKSSAFITGLGFAGFSLSMALGRFYGDTIIPKMGYQRLVYGGALLGTAGLVLAAVVPHPMVAILGFTIAGLGFSCVVPILYSVAARVPGTTPGLAIASVALAGITGAMTGRIMVGYVADYLGMSMALGCAAVLALTGALLARIYRWE